MKNESVKEKRKFQIGDLINILQHKVNWPEIKRSQSEKIDLLQS